MSAVLDVYVQRRILREFLFLQDLEVLDPEKIDESKTKSLANFEWKHSMLAPEAIVKIESLPEESHNIFANASILG